MSHSIFYPTIEKKEDIAGEASYLAHIHSDRQENPDGSYGNWMVVHDNIICEDDDHAIKKLDYLKSIDDRDHAVRYYESIQKEPTKQMLSMKERMDTNLKKREEYIEKHSVKNLKAKLITCTECESKLSRIHLRNDFCPLCHTDLRAVYIQERVEKFSEDDKKLKEQYKALEKRNSKKSKLVWMAIVDIHN